MTCSHSTHTPRPSRPAGRTGHLRRLVLPLATLLGLAFARPAAAQWLLPHLSGYDFDPNPPTTTSDTQFLLRGTFRYLCGQVTTATVVDSEHIEVTLDQGPACPDTTRDWSHWFDLGRLAAGNHTLYITLTVNDPDSGNVVEHGSFEYGVVDTSVYVPPPPPPPTSGFMPYVLQYILTPSRPNIGQPTTVDFIGYFPYYCGEVANATVVDASNIALTLRPGPACSDTLRTWTHRFDFGFLPLGHDSVTVSLTMQQPGAPDLLIVGAFGFEVYENGDPPPPPPPGDSLQTVLSNSRPNPFSNQTQFGVSLDNAVQGDVAIYDIGGRRIQTIYRGMLPRGTSQFAWNGRLSNGKSAPGGIYFYRLAMPGRIIARRVVLLGQP